MKKLSVSAIKDGIVIDHIPAGNAINILNLIRSKNKQDCITVGINLKGENGLYKDIVKIEDKNLNTEEISKIAIFAPNATVNIIKDYEVVSKNNPVPPMIMENVFSCPNSKCITNFEQICSKFHSIKMGAHYLLKCDYCEKTYTNMQIQNSWER